MYKALYRTYRPKNFNDIKGQDQIVQILQNQIAEGSVSHAYLFSGGRGTGKTSTAKVFAKAVNCQGPLEERPCNECTACKEGNIDIIEIDAASNNSVDNIRELRENVVYTPSFGRYKIYIIDEVHMLSAGAFNALLKTLEEPPDHVIFILATTEPQKIPATILSRCQRFDFKKIDEEVITDVMRDILKEIELEYEESALEFIASKSDGAMRDALSMLEQTLSYKHISYENVLRVAGTMDHSAFHNIIEAVSEQNPVKALETLQSIQDAGKNVKVFLSDMILYCRDMMVCLSGAEQLLSHSSSRLDMIRKSSQVTDIDTAVRLIEAFSALENRIKYSSSAAVLIEAEIIKLTRLSVPKAAASLEDSSGYIQDMKIRIAELEKKLEQLEKNQGSQKPLARTATDKTLEYTQRKKEKILMPYFDDVSKQEAVSDEERGIISEAMAKLPDVYEVLRLQKNVHLKALLQEAEIMRYIKDNIYMGYDDGFAFHKQTIDTPQNAEQVERAFKEVFKKDIKVQFIFKKEISSIKDTQEDETIEKIKEAFPGVNLEIKE